MTINYSDALLLQSIFRTEEDQRGSQLTALISYIDFIDNKVMTFHKFHQALKKLIALGLVAEEDGTLVTTDKFKNWQAQAITDKKRTQIHDEIDQAKAFLEEESKHVNETDVEVSISQSDFEAAVASHGDRMK